MVRPGLTGYSPLRMWRSVPQIVVSVTRITASPGPGLGIGTSSIFIWFGPRKTRAFIVLVSLRRWSSFITCVEMDIVSPSITIRFVVRNEKRGYDRHHGRL